MTPQQYIGLGLRVFAVWLAVSSLRNFVALPAALEGAGRGEMAVAFVVPIACAALAVALWLFPMWAATKLLPGAKSHEPLGLAPFDLAKIGSALIGLWIFSQAFLDTSWYILSALLVSGSQSFVGGLDSNAKLQFAIAVVALAFGAALVFKADLFAGIVVKLPEPTTDAAKG